MDCYSKYNIAYFNRLVSKRETGKKRLRIEP
jgi:hypothetical protein